MFQALLARSRAQVLVDEPYLPLPEMQFAWVAATRWLQPGRAWDARGQLTCLVGGTGSGKSLLCRKALREAVRRHSKCKFAVQTADEWLYDLFVATELGRFAEFCEASGKLAVVVCEDLDRDGRTPPTPPSERGGEDFFSPPAKGGFGGVLNDRGDLWTVWIDELLHRGVHVLITLSESPGRCDGLSPRIVSRLHGGLCARIPELERGSRQAFLRFAAAHHQLPLGEDVVAWCADQTPGTPRALWQMVERLSQQRVKTDLDSVQRWFLQRVPVNGRPQLAVIAREVASEFGVTVTDLRSQSRQLSLRLPRQCAMFLARDVAGYPMEKIGRFFGRRTHTSVSHSCRRLEELLPGSPTLRDHVERLRRRLLREDCA